MNNQPANQMFAVTYMARNAKHTTQKRVNAKSVIAAMNMLPKGSIIMRVVPTSEQEQEREESPEVRLDNKLTTLYTKLYGLDGLSPNGLKIQKAVSELAF